MNPLSSVTKDVWSHNLLQELDIAEGRMAFPYVFNPRGASKEEIYRATKFNVDKLKMVDFNPNADACCEASVEFFKKSDFKFRTR